MDHVIAKVKGFRKQPFFKLISDYTLFEPLTLNLNHFPEYSPDHNLDDDSWFKIEAFSEQSFCLDILKSDFNSVDYDDLKKTTFPKIAYLIAAQGDDFYFQKVTPSLFIKQKTVIFGEVAGVEESDNRLVINTIPDAVYIKSSDTLVFKKLATISSIFKGIDSLYKEATNQEVTEFLDESFIELTHDYGLDKVSKNNRKRIALAMSTLEAMSDDDKDSMLNYIDDYCEEKLSFDNNTKRFEISTDGELKILLFGIEQRFYTTPFGKEKRLANSVQSL
jgi:hypothetical protein